jgi:hypothetical protein
MFWTLIAFFLTLFIFSYLFGDNPLFRLMSYIFVGIVAGYGVVLVIYQVIIPRLINPLLSGNGGNPILALVALVMSLLLLFKLSARTTNVGVIPMAYLVGVGAAVAIGGAVVGTIFGQARGTIDMFDLQNSAGLGIIEALILLVGIVSTLIYFHFGAVSKANQPAHRAPIMEIISRVGQVYLAISLGALFAGVYAAAITAMIDRLDFIRSVISQVF